MPDGRHALPRRRVLELLGAGTLTTVAGCGQPDEPRTGSTPSEPPNASTRSATDAPDGTPSLTVVDVTVESDRVPKLDPLVVTTTVANDGGVAGRLRLDLTVDGGTVRARRVSVPPNGTTTVEFVVRPTEVGTRAVGVAGRTTTVEVVAPTRVLPAFRRPAGTLDTATPASSSERLLLTTLQGVVNRRRPRIYLPRRRDWAGAGGLSTSSHGSWELVEKYADEPDGVVVYDPAVPDTVNAATTVAGVENAVVAAPDHVSRLSSHGLEVRADLRERRGQFGDRVELYRWLFEEYWSATADRVLVGLRPTEVDGYRGPNPTDFGYTVLDREDETVRDLENLRTRTYDLTDHATDGTVYLRFDDSQPGDGWGAYVERVLVETRSGDTVDEFRPGTPAEREHLYDEVGSDLAGGGARFADHAAYFVYKLVVPDSADGPVVSVDVGNQYVVSVTGAEPRRGQFRTPVYDGDVPRWHFRDYPVAIGAMTVWLDPRSSPERELLSDVLSTMPSPSAYLGWWRDEVTGVRTASEHSVFVGAADLFDSATVWSGVRPTATDLSSVRPDPPAVPTPDETVYVTFTVTEGDNLQYCQGRMKKIWDDPTRGRVPINWSIAPMLLDVAPRMLEYYFETATANDHFVCGPSGIGYTYPKDWPQDDLGEFTGLTGKYLDEIDVETLYVLNRLGVDSTLSAETVRRYRRDVDPSGILLGWDGPDTAVVDDDLVVSSGIGGLHAGQSPSDVRRELVESVTDWGGDRPAFRSVGLFGFETSPSEVVSVVESLDDRFEVVRGDVFFELARQVLGG